MRGKVQRAVGAEEKRARTRVGAERAGGVRWLAASTKCRSSAEVKRECAPTRGAAANRPTSAPVDALKFVAMAAPRRK
jgi:hypothetical protein